MSNFPFVVEIADANVVVEAGGDAPVEVQVVAAGMQGPAGAALRHGYGAPDPGLGTVGDFYLNLTTYQMYGPKTQQAGWGAPTSLSVSVEHLSDVALDGLSDGQVLAWDAALGKWTNQSSASAFNYVHTQASAATTWVVQHNLGRQPGGVMVVDSAGTVLVGEITQDTADRLTVRFSVPVSGRVIVS